jgi:hypothetical protein
MKHPSVSLRQLFQLHPPREQTTSRGFLRSNTFERSDKDCPSRRRSAAGLSARPPKITFGEIHASGVREVLIYCRNHRCSHSVEISADRWPDDIRLSDIEPGVVCSTCGKRGAELRPKFSQARMGKLASAVVRAASMVGGWRRSHATKCASPRRAARQGMWESCIGATDLQ